MKRKKASAAGKSRKLGLRIKFEYVFLLSLVRFYQTHRGSVRVKQKFGPLLFNNQE